MDSKLFGEVLCRFHALTEYERTAQPFRGQLGLERIIIP